MSAGESAAPGPEVGCLVCHWPGQPDEGSCRQCGWDLNSSTTVARDREGHGDQLAARQRDHDLRAAVRVAGVAGDRDADLLARLAKLVRGIPPQPADIERAVARADREAGQPVTTSAGIGFTLARLVAGKTDAIAFVEVGRDALALQTLVIDERGALARRVNDSLPWSSLLPLLPADDNLRYLRMAGGVGASPRALEAARPVRELEAAGAGGGLPGAGGIPLGEDTGPAGLLDAIDDAITPALTRLMAASGAAAALGRSSRVASGRGSTGAGVPPRVDTVLVLRTHRWPLLDEAAARVRAGLRPVAEIIVLDFRPLAEIVDEAAVHAPLRYPYDLVLAHVDHKTGAVTPRRCELFRAGARVPVHGPPMVTIVELARPDHQAADRLALPIVERRGRVEDTRNLSEVEEQWPLVRLASLAPAGPRFTLTARLLRPGELDLAVAPGRFSGSGLPVGWPELLGELPDRLPPTSGEVDVVLLVELGGSGDGTVAARVELATRVVEEFRKEQGARVAVLGYRDHYGGHRVDAVGGRGVAEREALLVGCGLSTPAGALSVLGSTGLWREVRGNDRHAAPVECALRPLLARQFGWRTDARHVLIVLGSRPAHPPWTGPEGDVTLPCPHRFAWNDALNKLRRRQLVECLAVLDPGKVPPRARGFWEQLANLGIRWLGTDSAAPQALRQAAGSAPDYFAPLRFAVLAGGAFAGAARAGAASPSLSGKEAGS